MSIRSITKAEGAKRQLDTAIDLFFDEGDPLAVHTLAFAAFKVLLNLYSHHKDDAFGEQIDALIADRIGWGRFSETANFLKHADHDPDGLMEDLPPESGLTVIGLATLLYRRLVGDFSPKMEAFDFWIELVAADEIGIADADENKERVDDERQIRQLLRDASADERMKVAKTAYHYFLNNRLDLHSKVQRYRSEGKTLTQALEEHMSIQKTVLPE